MECTQRLECTQELYDTHTERTCPEQIGYLGICGQKYPVLKGPNKIGRDPSTCSIILNLNSVSRQHAVINVLYKEYLLMDLGSANKSKLSTKTLQPFISYPLRDGDTVQFGDIFGIFRLLEEDDSLPMTQALDIPETPVPVRHISKFNKAPTTIVPESPDVSDRDDSFLVPSLRRSGKSRTPNNKTTLIQSANSSKSDNISYSKKSTSLSFIDNPNTSLNESFISLKADKNKVDDIHELDTQAPSPIVNESADSIYTADTQIPPESAPSPSIHSLDTQLPTNEHLPQVRKIDGQHEVQFDIYAANKENNRDIFNAETQPFAYDNDDPIETVNNNKTNVQNKTSDCPPKTGSKEKLNTSEEELLFDDVDGDCIEEDFYSQNILPDELPINDFVEKPNEVLSKRDKRIESDGSTDCEDINLVPTQIVSELPVEQVTMKGKEKISRQIKASKRTGRFKSDSSTDCEDIDIDPKQKGPELFSKNKPKVVEHNGPNKASKRTERLKSDSSTDCEDIDIAPTQIIPELPIQQDTAKEKEKLNPQKRSSRIQSDGSTDCEDINMMPTQKIPEKKGDDDDDVTDCEDNDIKIVTNKPLIKDEVDDDDIPTQIIDVEHYKGNEVPFEDMPTQVIDIDENAAKSKNVSFEDQPTQIIDEIIPKIKAKFDEIKSPFKIPLQSPLKIKSKDIPKLTPNKIDKMKFIDVEDNYYNSTQDIADDLCTQRENSPEILGGAQNEDDEVVPCSVEDYKVGEKFANIERDLSPKKDDIRVTNIKNLSNQEVKKVVNPDAKKLRRMPSDSSDVESTPTKVRQFIFTDSDLPNSQEIKTSMMSHTRTAVTESSSESETENCSEDQLTPFVHRKKKIKPVAKIDLTKKFEVEKLPERVLTRQRKLPAKLQNSSDVNKQKSASILKPTYLTEQEDQIDGDIIVENIKRLKSFNGKSKTSKDSKNNDSVKEEPEETPKKKAEDKSKEPKEKIKVKIEKPKKKDSKSKSESSIPKSDVSEKNKTKEDSLDSTSTSKSSRRTRSRKHESDTSTKSEPSSKKEPDNKRKRTTRKQEKERSKSPEIEVRRSSRQQKAKEKNVESKGLKSILKKSIHEQSTVYNISSSSNESPKNLKRSMVDDAEVPSPKRTRASNTDASSYNINNVSLRATPARLMKTQHVLFTAFPSAEVKQKLEKLGAVIVTNVLECSVVLTMQIKRTFKLLCAVGLGRPIVGPSWVQACADTHMIVDPWLYLVKDEGVEKRFQFNLSQTLSGKRNFLKGYNVSSTPSVQPDTSEMKLIVECSGGTWKEGGSNWVCVSTSKDKALWSALTKRGATIVSTEFILSGVLRQKVDITPNKLV